MSNSNADEPPENYTTHPPPPPSLSSLPDEIDLSSLYVCFQEEYNDTSFHWLTLCPTEETSSTTTEYEFQLLPNPTPFPSHKYGTSTVAVGLNIFFTKLDVFIFHADAMSEYEGKLVVLYMWGESKVDDTVTKSVRCKLVSVHRAGDRICGTIDWSGVVGTVPSSFCFLHCLAVSE
ncbi:unnamed protein product [Brassica oleracea]